MITQTVGPIEKRKVGRPKLFRLFISKCFLCKQKFFPQSKHFLFCESCKAHSESYRFADWMTTAG